MVATEREKMNFLLKKQIYYIAKKQKMKIPFNYEEILKSYIRIADSLDATITFDSNFDPLTKDIEAKYSNYRNKIILNPGWAARIVLYDNESTKNAFKLTIGHELGHRKDFPKKFYLCRCRKFISWANEVQHDFYGAKVMVNSDKQKLIEGVDYKSTLKPNNKDSCSHPSWKRRLEYAKKGVFDSNLIERIAADVGCKNEKLIQEVCEFYKEPMELM